MVIGERITAMSQNQKQPPSIPPYQGGSLYSDEYNGKGSLSPPLTRDGFSGLSPSPDKGWGSGLSPSPDKGRAGEGLKEISYIEAVIHPM